MRVLVTGGLGFIGSHLVDRLVADGHDIVVLDSLHPGAHAQQPDYANSGAQYHLTDLRDEDAVRSLTRNVEAVSHQAARVGLGVVVDDVAGYVADNDVGTAVLLQALHRNGFDGRLVLASSMVIYGEGAYDCLEHGKVAPPPRNGTTWPPAASSRPAPVVGRRCARPPSPRTPLPTLATCTRR